MNDNGTTGTDLAKVLPLDRRRGKGTAEPVARFKQRKREAPQNERGELQQVKEKYSPVLPLNLCHPGWCARM